MSKIKDFFAKALVEDAAKKEIIEILSEKKLVEATDDQLAKISEVAKKLGVNVTAEEMKEFASGGVELNDDELEAVGGGVRPRGADGWFVLALEVKLAGDDEKALAEVAKRYGVSKDELRENWSFFKYMGFI